MLVYFALTLFVSASLLFLVQPMVGKMILPHLGGTPAVWNTCMVFFQTVLLAGYGYTHALNVWCDRRRQVLIHVGLLLLPFVLVLLPFGLGNWEPPEKVDPIYSVLVLLLGIVGLPFFVVATSAPLLQKWFAGTGHPAGKDPYFLYGASNLGSLLALVLYPAAVEPLLGLEGQAWLWTIGYCLLTILAIGCIFIVWRTALPAHATTLTSPTSEAVPAPTAAQSPPSSQAAAVQRAVVSKGPARPADKPSANSARAQGKRSASAAPPAQTAPPQVPVRSPLLRRLRWVVLAFVPSSLMLGVTTHLTMDIAAIPFFWVIPLSLYLVTFVLVFSRWPVVWTEKPHRIVLYAQPVALGLLVLVIASGTSMRIGGTIFVLHVLAFFFTALMCHGELARDRPGTELLTEFYFWLSFGGMLGGVFNALIAPLIFRFDTLEYSGTMIFALLLRPNMVGKKPWIPGDSSATEATTLGNGLNLIVPLLVGLWTCGLFITALDHPRNIEFFIFLKVLTAAAIMGMFARPLRCALSLAMFGMVISNFDEAAGRRLFADRDFFGFVRVRVERGKDDEFYKALIHGRINHGWQSIDPNRRREPLTYFHPTGGVGQVFQRFSWYGYPGEEYAWPDARLPASMIGLGASPLDPLLGLAVGTQSEPAFGVVGLGIGTLAVHAKPLQFVRFYEIDPLVIRLSTDKTLSTDRELWRGNVGKEPIYTFVEDAKERGSRIDIVLGDGRLKLREDRVEGYYHILVLDAFSSDAIPVHLLTREAVTMYLSKLADGGLLVFNTSNRHVDITGVLADLAHDPELNLNCYYYADAMTTRYPTKFESHWVVLERKQRRTGVAFNGGPPFLERMRPLPTAIRELEPPRDWIEPARLGQRVWTDQYSNILSVLIWR